MLYRCGCDYNCQTNFQQTQQIDHRETDTIEKMVFSYYRQSTGCWFGVSVQVKVIAPNCAMKHCIIHNEALAVNPLTSHNTRVGSQIAVVGCILKLKNFVQATLV